MTYIFPDFDKLEPGLKRKLRDAINSKKTFYNYRGTTFELSYKGGQLREIKVGLRTLKGELPRCLRTAPSPILLVQMECTSWAAREVKAAPGLYAGDDYRAPGVICIVDPKGEHNSGKPQIMCNGPDFSTVQRFFQLVMAGGLTPGERNDRWAGPDTKRR